MEEIRSETMAKLLLATNNRGKIEELRDLLHDSGAELLTPQDLQIDLEVEESGKTYLENASKKAAAYASKSGLLSLADDSGLEVDALGGAPGIYSARYAPNSGASDRDRRVYLLAQLKELEKPWLAKFHCTVVLATPNGEVHSADGECAGEIIPDEKGTWGFGYDPIFFIADLGKTMAELNMQEKNQISHRARAVQSLWATLIDQL